MKERGAGAVRGETATRSHREAAPTHLLGAGKRAQAAAAAAAQRGGGNGAAHATLEGVRARCSAQAAPSPPRAASAIAVALNEAAAKADARGASASSGAFQAGPSCGAACSPRPGPWRAARPGMSGAGGGGAPRGALALLALLLVGATAALTQIWASAHLREAARATARFERLYHSSMDEAVAWRDKHDAAAKSLESARAAVAAAQRSSAALQAKKAELKEALRAAEEEVAACREAGRGDGGREGAADAQLLSAHGRKRRAEPPPDDAAVAEAEGDAPAPQRGGEHRTPDARAAAIDPHAAARDKAAANGAS